MESFDPRIIFGGRIALRGLHFCTFYVFDGIILFCEIDNRIANSILYLTYSESTKQPSTEEENILLGANFLKYVTGNICAYQK